MSTTNAARPHDDASEAVCNHDAQVPPLGCQQAWSRLSHELRTPLNAVLGFAQLLRNLPQGQLDTELGRAYLEHIENSGWKLLKVIDAMLVAAADARPCQPSRAPQSHEAPTACCSKVR